MEGEGGRWPLIVEAEDVVGVDYVTRGRTWRASRLYEALVQG